MAIKRFAGALLASALCACSGSFASGGAVPPTPASGLQSAFGPLGQSGTALEVRLAVPKPASKADFVSPNTRSIVVVQGKTTLGTFDTTPKSKGCKALRIQTSCTFIMSATAGKNQHFRIRAYGKKSGKGNLLSEATVVKTIVANKVNRLSFTMNGVVASIVVNLSDFEPIVGTATTIDVYVDAMDASGATIIGKGDYVPSIKLHDSDTSGATVLSAEKVTGPSTKVTLAYNGSSSLSSATISATAKGVPSTKITSATLRPVTSIGQVTESGTTAFSVVSDPSGNVVAFLPTSAGVASVTIASGGSIPKARASAPGRRAPQLKLSPAPDECAPDLVHAQVYCMSFSSNIVSIISFDPGDVLKPPALAGQTTTDAPSSGVSFSGATCVICGIAYDPTDNAFIISTAKGYELWPTTPGATHPVKTLAAPISENFGYNAVTDQIFSAYYNFSSSASAHGLDVIDIPSSTRYVLSNLPAYFSDPDAGAIDVKTNIAFAPEEASVPIYIDNLNAPPAAYTPGSPGSYTSPVAAVDPGSSLIRICDETYTAADSVADYAFFGSEYCPNDYIAVGQLPTTTNPATLGFSNFVAAQLPNTPNGAAFASPLDPHAVVVVNLPGICPDCGVLFNYDKSYLAIVNLTNMLALNTTGTPEYDVPYPNALSGVLTYIATGISSSPSKFARELAAARARGHVLH
jgi:hypothetical protein